MQKATSTLYELAKIAETIRPNMNWKISPSCANAPDSDDSDMKDMLRCAILKKKEEDEQIQKFLTGEKPRVKKSKKI